MFDSLSEGEKTLITFLYFLELIQGDFESDSTFQLNRRVIVIDDPVNSLSHNFVYDIASLIRYQIIKETQFPQIFIFTHSLFFFHELLKIAGGEKENYQLFRLTKNEHSLIKEMDSREIKNEYESYWQVIKDVKQGHANKIVLPNMMRNILEYYFAFLHREDKLYKSLQNLEQENPEYKPLYRYINRESHADAININDFGSIDPSRYLEKFREVFIRTGFEEHYKKMMAES